MTKAKLFEADGGDVLSDLEKRAAREPEVARLASEKFDAMQLARQIRAQREAAGLTQAELGLRLHTPQTSIARLESGRVIPRLDMLFRVAAALGSELVVGFKKAPARASSPLRRKPGALRRTGRQPRGKHAR